LHKLVIFTDLQVGHFSTIVQIPAVTLHLVLPQTEVPDVPF